MSNLHTGRLGKGAMKFESAWGTFVAADRPLRIMSESIKATIGKVTDEELVSEDLTSQRVKVSANYAGGLELAAHPEEFGALSYWTMGQQAAVADPVAGYLMITFTGSDDYQRLSLVGTELLSEVSSDGSSWGTDANWNSGAVLDLALPAQDTLAEAAAVITAFTGYIAEAKGTGSAASTDIAAFAVTSGKTAGVFTQMFALASQDTTSSTTKLHVITPVAVSALLPSTSVTIDRTLGTNESVGYPGTKVISGSIAVSAADLAKFSLTVSAKDEETGKTYPALTIPTVKSYVAPKICLWINGIIQDEFKDFTLGINSNLTQDNVICNYNIIEQIRQGREITFSATMNLDTTAVTGNWDFYAANFIADKTVEIVIYMEAPEFADETNGIYYNVLIRINKFDLDDFTTNLPGPGIMTIAMSGIAVKSDDFDHIQIDVTDAETAIYA